MIAVAFEAQSLLSGRSWTIAASRQSSGATRFQVSGSVRWAFSLFEDRPTHGGLADGRIAKTVRTPDPILLRRAWESRKTPRTMGWHRQSGLGPCALRHTSPDPLR